MKAYMKAGKADKRHAFKARLMGGYQGYNERYAKAQRHGARQAGKQATREELKS